VLATVGTRLPIVWVKHDHSWDGPLARAIALRCRLVVGVSRAVTRVFSGRIARRVRVAYTGVVPPDVVCREGRAVLIAALATKEGARIVGIVGYLAPGKGQHELVEVAPELLRRLPNARSSGAKTQALRGMRPSCAAASPSSDSTEPCGSLATATTHSH
jgi:glycosyltransferase involved in cell wall biosynthesis